MPRAPEIAGAVMSSLFGFMMLVSAVCNMTGSFERNQVTRGESGGAIFWVFLGIDAETKYLYKATLVGPGPLSYS